MVNDHLSAGTEYWKFLLLFRSYSGVKLCSSGISLAIENSDGGLDGGHTLKNLRESHVIDCNIEIEN